MNDKTQRLINFVTKKSENFSIILLRIAFAIIIIVTAIFLLYFTIGKYVYPPESNNVASNPLDNMANDTLLAIFSLLIAFTGLLAFIFRHLVRDSIHEELKTMTYDERNASNAETRLSSSNIFSKLHEMTEKIKVNILEENILEDNKKQKEKCENDPCRVYSVFKTNGFLNSAIMQDKLALLSVKKIVDADHYKDTYIKVLNNRSYNLYLKYKKWEELTNEQYKLTHEDKLFILKAKHEIRKFLVNKEYHLYENITSYQIAAFERTCQDIDTLASSSQEWKDLQEEMNREFMF